MEVILSVTIVVITIFYMHASNIFMDGISQSRWRFRYHIDDEDYNDDDNYDKDKKDDDFLNLIEGDLDI